MKNIILASGSPRRAELIKKISGVKVDIVIPNVCEDFYPEFSIEENIIRVCCLKAQQVKSNKQVALSLQKDDAIILACDTVVVCDGKVLGKPKDNNDALEMFKMLENRTHTVITGVCFVNNSKKIKKVEKTAVTFGALNYKIVYNYIETNNSCDKAGGYGIQDKEIESMIYKVDGSLDNVIGLPTELVETILKEYF